MRKRIALFIIGLVLSLGAFWLYQTLTGASFLNLHKAPPVPPGAQDAERPPTYEQRAPNGDLLYLLSAQQASPLKEEGKVLPGQYDLVQPRATYYTADGNVLYIRADHGRITINDQGGAKGSRINDHFRGAHLSGNVVLTYGPRDSFTETSLDIKTGQYQVRFEKDLDLNYTEGIVTSPGRVHLRAYEDRVRFDGENLTIAFNHSEKKQGIELLRVEPTSGKDNYLLIRDAASKGFGFEGPGGEPGATTRPTPTSATATATARASSPAPQSPATNAPATQTAASKPAAPPITYKISLGKNVTATLGTRKLTSDQLFVFFEAPAAPPGSKGLPSPTSPPNSAPLPPPTTPSTTMPANPAYAPALAPASPPPPPALKPGDDLVVTWTGPMEMRPSAKGDVQLMDRFDKVIEALGTLDRPVRVQDETRTAVAGILDYHKSVGSVNLQPGAVGPVVVTSTDPADPSHGVSRLTCQGLNFSSGENHVHLDGPGRIEVPQSALRRTESHPGAQGSPLTVAWEKALDLELASRAKGKGTTAGAAAGTEEAKYSIRRAVFAGRTSITDADFHLDSDALDVLVAAGENGGRAGAGAEALEHLLATGHVHVKGANRTGAGIADADQPDGLNADRLEVLTALSPDGKTRSPSRLLADGNVVAWAYATDRAAKAHRLPKQTLYTPKFDARLAPKTPDAKRETGKTETGGLANVRVNSFVATDGVIVEIENANSPTIYAQSKTLTAHMENGYDSATAVLDGEQLANGATQMAEVSQGERGENKITGLHILLDQKNKAIDIPGPGTFNFVQLAQKPGQQPMPAEVTWTQAMHFDEKSLLAHFTGDIDAHLVGRTDQISRLTCDKVFDVQLAKAAGAKGASASDTAPGQMHLAKITARGNVNALGSKFDKNGKMLSSIYLTKTDLLTYNEASKNLDIPGPGQLVIQDYTPDKPGTTNNSHGDTLFTWDGSLTYNGPTDTIAFSKNVFMNHHPLKPFKMPGADAPKKPASPAATQPAPDQHLLLTTDALIAKLYRVKAPGVAGTTAYASPLALGAGDQPKLESVLAQGHAVMRLGEDSMTAESLEYDELTRTAIAAGTQDDKVVMVRPEDGISTWVRVKWDMAKNTVEATDFHGAMQQN